MNKLHLFFMTIYDNSIRILILTLGCFFSCALLLGIFYTADEYITVFSYARNGHIEDYVFVNDDMFHYYSSFSHLLPYSKSSFTIDEVLESVSVDGAEASYFCATLQCMDFVRHDDESPYESFDISYPGTPSFSEIKQKIVEGRLPEARNEIVLCYEAKGDYSLGDTIQIAYFDYESLEWHPITVQVVGFMPKKCIKKSQGCSVNIYASLENLFNRDSMYDEYKLYDAFIGQPFDYTDDGVPVKLRFNINTITYRATDGRTTEELYDDILEAYPGLSENTITGTALKEHYWQEKRPIILKLVIAFILSVMLFACFLIGSLYLQAREKSLEMSVLYAHGMTWAGASFLVCASYFPGILLGMISGIIFFFAVAEKGFGLYCYFQFSYVAWTCLICLGISILCTIPIYIRMARQSPIEVIRKD